jgi:A/G-specific adenine glycosylase
LAEAIVANDNRIPTDPAELVKLPGVGNYVAAAWLSFHNNTCAVLIDANIVLWLCRLILYPMDGETRRKAWLREMADDFTPEEDWKQYNYAVLDFTMEICGRVPQCEVCPVGPTNYCLTGKTIIPFGKEPL